MSRITKLITVLTAFMLFTVNSAFAQTQFIQFNGKTSEDAIGVTVLVTDKDANLSSLKNDQIFYINQYNVNSDGSFSAKLPLFSETLHSFYTNADPYSFLRPDEKITLYVSSTGNDANSGQSSENPLQTLAHAYELIDYTDEIVIMDSVTFTNPPASYEGDLTIKGNDGAVLTLPSTVSLKGNLTLSNLTLSGASTIFANGYNLKIDETVTSDANLTVYGGTNGTAYTGDTSIELLGGTYYRVYGGSNNAVVTGSTNVVFGGNANSDKSNIQSASNYMDSRAFGGGNGANSNVTEETNVTLSGNAVLSYVAGSNNASSNAPSKINVNIAGGKAMNIFGGNMSTDTNITVDEINVNMTGGLVEAVFGGSQSSSVTGNVFVNLLGGTVARRVYSGCYNNYASLKWVTDHYVKGTTTLSLSPDVALNATSNIPSDEQTNVGVYVGSRAGSNHSDEIKTLIYLDNCYSAQSGNMGPQDFSGKLTMPYRTPNYIVKAGTGGKVLGTKTAGTVYIAPDEGKCGLIGENVYINENVALSSGTTTVLFDTNFKINSVTETVTDTSVSGTVNATANNLTNETNPFMIVAVYDGKQFISCSVADTKAGPNDYSFNLDYDFEAGKEYTLKVMIWNEEYEPLVSQYKLTIQK